MFELSPVWVAMISSVIGGISLKLVDHWFNKSRDRIAESNRLREELKQSIDELKTEIDKLESEVDDWKDKYYDTREKYNVINTEYMIALEKIKALVEKLDIQTNS